MSARLSNTARHFGMPASDARRMLLCRFSAAVPFVHRLKPCPWKCADATMSQRHILGACAQFHDAYVARHDAAVKLLFSHVWKYSQSHYDVSVRNTAEN